MLAPAARSADGPWLYAADDGSCALGPPAGRVLGVQHALPDGRPDVTPEPECDAASVDGDERYGQDPSIDARPQPPSSARARAGANRSGGNFHSIGFRYEF